MKILSFQGSVSDDGDEAIADYDREEEEENVEYRELDLDRLVLEASQVDTTGICTVASEDRRAGQPSGSKETDDSKQTVPRKYLHFYSNSLSCVVFLQL